MKPGIPAVLAQEHANLLAGLEAAKQEPGALGEAARELAVVLEAHIRKEEEFAFPPLGLLPALEEGRIPDDPAEVLAMVRRLKAELPELLLDHRKIREGVQRLRAAAAAANRPSFERYADALIRHADVEDEVLYLSAILVGEYLLMRREGARSGRPAITTPPRRSGTG